MRINIIVDLDGTLCDITHRLHLIKCEKPEWDAFFLACDKDGLIRSVDTVISHLWDNFEVHLFSGRGEIARELTERWLDSHDIHYESLTMRPVGNFIPDEELKKSWVVEKGFAPENTLCVFDDRAKVVKMWRELGFACFQVADGNF